MTGTRSLKAGPRGGKPSPALVRALPWRRRRGIYLIKEQAGDAVAPDDEVRPPRRRQRLLKHNLEPLLLDYLNFPPVSDASFFHAAALVKTAAVRSSSPSY